MRIRQGSWGVAFVDDENGGARRGMIIGLDQAIERFETLARIPAANDRAIADGLDNEARAGLSEITEEFAAQGLDIGRGEVVIEMEIIDETRGRRAPASSAP